MDANFLITHDPTHTSKVRAEVEVLLKDVGGGDIIDSNVDGVMLVKTHKNSKDVAKKLKEMCRTDSSRFAFTFKWVPIEKWCSSDMHDMEKVMKEIDEKMDPDESWKMDLGKRNYEGNAIDIIMKLTGHINKPKVDLKNPQKIIKVEIIGEKAGISLLDADEFLDTHKL